MLNPRTQVPRALYPRHLQRSQRAFSDSGSTARRGEQQHHNADRRGIPAIVPEARTAYLRLSNFLRSPAEGYAVIRALERKYGAIREFRFLKDFELPSVYQHMVHIAFRDTEALDRLPKTKETFSITLPSTIPDRPGGVGLDELEAVLEVQEYADDSNIPAFGNVMDSVLQNGVKEGAEKTSNVIECTIERSNAQLYTPSAYPGRDIVRRKSGTARSFIKWGGFYPLEPIPADIRISNTELFGATNVDHVRLRRVLREYCDQLGKRNPYEIYPISKEKPSTVELSPKSEEPQPEEPQPEEPQPEEPKPMWEPLPGHESTSADMPTASAIQATPTQPEAPTSVSTTVDTSPPSTPITEAPTAEPSPPPTSKVQRNAQASGNTSKKGNQPPPPAPKRKADAAKKQKPLPDQKDDTISFREIRINALQERRQKVAETAGSKDTGPSTATPQRPQPPLQSKPQDPAKRVAGLKDRLKGFMGGLF